MGVPDLLLLSIKKINGINTAVIEAGDIKSSRSPRFHHKWQVAFYALLLKRLGATDENQEGVWEWVTGEAWAFVYDSGW